MQLVASKGYEKDWYTFQQNAMLRPYYTYNNLSLWLTTSERRFMPENGPGNELRYVEHR